MCGDQIAGIDQIRLHQTCKAYNKKTDPALFLNTLKVFNLMFLDEIFRKACTVLRLFGFKVYVSSSIETVVVGRGGRSIVGFRDFRTAPAGVVHMDDLYRGRLFIDQGPLHLPVVQIGSVEIVFQTGPPVCMVVAHAAHALRLMRKGSIERLRLFDGTTELLDGLHARGAKVYLLSNAQAAFTVGEIAEVGLADKLDGVLLSSDCGCRKPDPAFYEMLFDKFDLDKRDAVMIGDDMQNDVRGAERFGIRGLWADGGAAAHAAEILALAD